MTDTELRRLAENNRDRGYSHISLRIGVVIGLLDRIKALEVERNAARSEAVDHATDADARQLVVTALLSEGEAMRARIDELEREKSDMLRGAAKALEEALRAHAAKGRE